jgi:hypothetical protein
MNDARPQPDRFNAAPLPKILQYLFRGDLGVVVRDGLMHTQPAILVGSFSWRLTVH